MAARKPKSLAEVVKDGDYRASLEALRDRLAAEIAETGGSAVAALSKQLADVLRVLDSMTVPEVSASDDLARRRAARRGAKAPAPAPRARGSRGRSG